MLPENTAVGIIYFLIFTFAILVNVFFILYLIINKVRTSVDKLFLNLSIFELLVVVLGIPFVNDVWLGEPYKYGSFGCHGAVPLYLLCEFVEALTLCLLAVFIAEKLKGVEIVQKQAVVSVGLVFIASLIMIMPFFGINILTVKDYMGKEGIFCVEDWNIVALRIFRLLRIVFQSIVPLVLFVYFHRKSWKIIKFMHEAVGSKKVSAKYRSFSKVVAETADKSEPHFLKFSESEEMNLEMNHIYKRENSISSSIQKDEDSSNVSVQIYTNEVTIDKITSDTPLWRGRKPDTKWKQENEYQKLVVSIKWFKYTRNLFKICFVVSIVYITSIIPSQIMMVYSLFVEQTSYNDDERLAAQIVFCLRFIPAVVNPWLFLLGILKYRRSICQCCKC